MNYLYNELGMDYPMYNMDAFSDEPRAYEKRPMNKRQQKSRAKSKNAKRARKLNH